MHYTKLSYTIKAPKPNLFIGSKIRGTLGYYLKEEVCVNPSFECDGCFAQKECLFFQFYEKQNTTHKYRLDFKLMAKKYKFSLFLFGESQKHKETMHKAIVNSLAEYKEFTYKQKSKKLKIKSYTPIVKLSFLTPLRIKKQNRFARKDIELLDILLSIHRRYLDLQSLPYEKVQLDTEYKIVTKNLYYQELTRRSNKQNTKMNLGGLMGEIVVSGVSKEVYELLKIGEVIGAGKNPVFGLGKIKVEEIK
jgi:hypothetical protein